MWAWSAWALALSAGLLGSCLGELPRGRSCGDGWWDPEFEACDPSSPDPGWVDACRNQGRDVDATCTDLCELEASADDCNRCGDGIAGGTEECDGDDLRGTTCPGGSGAVRCTDACTLDFDLCPAVCGDGIVNGSEECDIGLRCGTDEDCGSGRVCYLPLGECITAEVGGFAPQLACGYYDTTAIAINKPYASGIVGACTDECKFARDDCGFCGDGHLDDAYQDIAFTGDLAFFPEELCDGDRAIASALEAYCEPLCIDEFVAANVTVSCDFECATDCKDFAPPDDVTPGEIGCCLAEDSPCPFPDTDNVVPDLPCCAWAGKPVEQHTCVPSGNVPVSYVCP